jgi:hypothetical protein
MLAVFAPVMLFLSDILYLDVYKSIRIFGASYLDAATRPDSAVCLLGGR